MNFFEELKKRNVLRVGAAYLVVSWLVLQFIDVVFPMLGIDESLGKPVLILLLLGLPIALLLAWFLEMTPDGVKREKDLDRSAMASQSGGRKMDRVIIVFLIAALGLLLFDRFVVESTSPEDAQVRTDYSLAVLPFTNLSGNVEDEYFSDGLTETLLHMLAQIPELKVSARTSVFAFKGRDEDVRDIATSLGVANILEGSVQRSGNRVRITAQLISAETGFHLWSRNFDRDLDDIFAVQDEIASSVASALQSTLLGAEQKTEMRMAGIATQNTGAYESYLQGLEQKNIASYSSLPQAEGLFKRALSMDPEFCEAKLELAYAYQLQADTGLLTSQESEARIRPLIDQVLEVRPSEGRALGLLATINWRNAVLSGGPLSPAAAAAQEDIERAIELAPNDPALYAALAQVHATLNNPEEALSWTEKGLVVDPMSARLNMQRGQFLLTFLDRPEEAVEAFAKARKQAPDWTAVLISSARADFRIGNFASGVEWYLDALATDPQDHEIPSQLARTYYQLGLADEGDRMYERARAIAPQEPWTRSLELGRQLRANNHERAVLLAESIIHDDLENRGNAYSLAVAGYVSSMIELGKGELVPEFFESLIPGISGADYQPNDLKEVGIKFMIAMSLANAGSYDAAEGILNPLIVGADATAPGWREARELMMTVSIVQGDQEAAVQYAFDDLSRTLSEQMNWDLSYRHTAWVKPLLKNDRIASRLAELEVETRAAGESVRDMLATRIAETG